MVTARYVRAIKSDKYEEELYNLMKDYLVQGAEPIQCISVHIILVFAKINSFRILVVDVNFAYLQSDKPLIRKIFITNSAPELELSAEEFPELLKII